MKTKAILVIAILNCLLVTYEVKADALEIMFNCKDTLSFMFRQNPGTNESVTVFAKTNTCNFINDLYNNKDYLVRLYSECKPIIFPNKAVFPCGGKESKELFDTLINSEKSVKIWHLNRQKIFDFFMDLYKRSEGIRNDSKSDYIVYQKGDCVNDDTLVRLLICCMGDTTNYTQKIIPECYSILFRFTAYSKIVSNAGLFNEINNSIRKFSNDYLKLKVLLNNDTLFKDSILRMNNIPPEYRARLGDTIAAQELVTSFINASNYQQKKALAEKLIFTGNNHCIQAVVTHLYDSVYFVCRTKITETLRWPIYSEMRKWFPDSEFKKQFQVLVNSSHMNDSDYVKTMDSIFIKWTFDKFQVKPEKSTNVYILQKECEKDY